MREIIANHAPNENVKTPMKVIKSLREKELAIAKADKSNNLIVIDESNYERVLYEVIRDGPYVEMENDPLNDMVKHVK